MKATSVIPYKRKLRKTTNYRRRLNLLAGHMPRLVVRKSLRNIHAQIVNFGAKGDHIITGANSTELRKFGWDYSLGNLPSAYLTGLLVAKKAEHHKIKKAVLDIGLSRSVPGSAQYALIKGAIDAGMDIPHSKEMIPDESRIKGSHIVAYSKHAKGNQFSSLKKSNLNLEEMPKALDHVKSKILKETEHGKKARK